nr:tRNA (adenosine(37)-N6)-dimethylallyltransferase MiaA [Hydrogenimonas thermophila]
MKTIAILGPTASGKSALSLELARNYNCVILSLDSLALYREIDIASAKPTITERGDILHFGIDVIDVDTPFNVALFIDLYKESVDFCKEQNKNLIIVGGTGFYLKTLIEGISELPKIDEETKKKVEEEMGDLQKAYSFLSKIDEVYAKNLMPTDRYRIEKALTIFYQTGTAPSLYFKNNPPKPVAKDLELFEISIDKEVLNRRIELRTNQMFEMGLVDEIANLEYKYGRNHNPMKAIGVKEILDYFDGKCSLKDAKELISIHTRQLAKRQRTFNRTQFPPHIQGTPEELKSNIAEVLLKN